MGSSPLTLYHGSRRGISGAIRPDRSKILPLAAIACLSTALFAESVDVTVRRAPYVVSTVSSKSEKAWAECRYCGSKTGYERTYKWDVYNHVWVETTKAENVPDVCRKCKAKVKDQAKLDRRERELDRKIDYEESRIRIKKKEDRLKALRNEAR